MSIKNKYKYYLQTKEGIESYNKFKSILYSKNDTLIDSIFDTYFSNNQIKQELHFCDIGGGDGKRISNLCNKINRKINSRIYLDFIEQSRTMCIYSHKYFLTIKHFCTATIYQNEIENINLTNTYDVIFLIHSIFCFSDFSIINRLKNCLKRDGTIIIVSNSSNSFLATLKREMDLTYSDKRYEVCDLIKDLNSNGIFFEHKTISTNWNIPSVDFEKKISMIFQWLSLGEYEKYSPPCKKYLLELVKENSIYDSGIYYFFEREQIITIKNR